MTTMRSTGTCIDKAMVWLIWKHTPRDAVLLCHGTDIGIYIGVLLTVARLPAIVIGNIHIHAVDTSILGSAVLTVNIRRRGTSITGMLLLRKRVGIGTHGGA